MAEADLDRNHAATPYKLQKARERGQVAKSQDITSAVVFSVAAAYLAAQAPRLWHQALLIERSLLVQVSHSALTVQTVQALVDRILLSSLWLIAPLLAALMISGVVGNLIQTGPVLSMEPLSPDWSRLSPVAGLKRLFSMRTLFMALRAILKLVLLSAVAYVALKAMIPQFFKLSTMSPALLVTTLFADAGAFSLKMAAVLACLALLDLLYSKREFATQMRMSQKEMKDEHKNREGDPRIRARMRELRREVFKRSKAIQKTKGADVLITNPTHVAIALRYVHGQMSSPQLLAKGKGPMAAVMRQIANRHHVPIVRSPELARTLYRELPLEHHVPPELYAPVARIIVWVFAQRDAQSRAHRSAGAAGAES